MVAELRYSVSGSWGFPAGAGTWRSLAARLTGGQKVAGSNPVVPTSLASSSSGSSPALPRTFVRRSRFPAFVAFAEAIPVHFAAKEYPYGMQTSAPACGGCFVHL